MNTRLNKTTESQNQPAAVSRITSDTDDHIRFEDNRNETNSIKQLQAKMNNNHSCIKLGNLSKFQSISKGNSNAGTVSQLTKVFNLQNHLTKQEVEELQDHKTHLNAELIESLTEFIADGNVVGVDENITIVTHGNTTSVGDDKNYKKDLNGKKQKISIDLNPRQLGKLIGQLLPAGYKGKITLNSCHGADSEDGEPSMIEQTYGAIKSEEFAGTLAGYKGEVTGVGENAKSDVGTGGRHAYKKLKNAEVIVSGRHVGYERVSKREKAHRKKQQEIRRQRARDAKLDSNRRKVFPALDPEIISNSSDD